ncbi:VWA domain-containing protein [Dongia sp.]|uniref:vWA domain-containing protein n=1 Tax=Dongia sp. TaxID=1977262 RepID=UPI0035B4C227
MSEVTPDMVSDAATASRLHENILHFARVLRRAGLPVGPGQTLDAIAAVKAAGIGSREDFYWVLHAIFVNRRDQREIFDQAFHVFWRNPKLLNRIMGLLLPRFKQEPSAEDEELAPRVADAMAGDRPHQAPEAPEGEEIELDASLTFSDRELLQAKDFERMSAAEIAEAKQLIRHFRLPIMEVPTRRHRPDRRGRRVDLRATLRASLRNAGAIPLKLKSPKRRHPPLVVLCDISGSMSRYSRLFLHFLHAVTSDRDRVHTFLFGTRLTNITRDLKQRDVDVSLDRVARHVLDWSGGTRIGPSLAEFNRRWGRRVLGQGAIVLLITDGLDRDAIEVLEAEMERLHKSCRRLIWLNPLLRFEAYQPISQGPRVMIRHVDEFRAIHNLDSMQALTAVLSAPGRARLEMRAA